MAPKKQNGSRPRRITFAALSIPKEELEAVLLPLLPADAVANKQLRPEYHVTVKYFGGQLDPTSSWYTEHEAKLNTEIVLQCTTVVWDDKGVAVAVAPTFPCANEFPHITIGCGEGVAPVYSNALLGLPDGGDTHVSRMAVDVTLRGVHTFM